MKRTAQQRQSRRDTLARRRGRRINGNARRRQETWRAMSESTWSVYHRNPEWMQRAKGALRAWLTPPESSGATSDEATIAFHTGCTRREARLALQQDLHDRRCGCEERA